VGCFGLRASVDFLLQVGIENIAPVVQALGDQIVSGAAGRGWEIMGTRTRATGAGIVSIRKQGVHPNKVVAHLRGHAITAAARAGWVRLAPHFYILPEEIEKMLGCLP
jgi:selenocysteine lyase/cysteine desulfurase